MARSYPNIEIRSWRRNAQGQPIYVAYGGGETWYVDRPHKRAQWRCYSRCAQVRFMPVCRDTLAEISAYIAAFDR
jgi:hypothetical protein